MKFRDSTPGRAPYRCWAFQSGAETAIELWRSQDERAADLGYLTLDGDRVILHNPAQLAAYAT